MHIHSVYFRKLKLERKSVHRSTNFISLTRPIKSLKCLRIKLPGRTCKAINIIAAKLKCKSAYYWTQQVVVLPRNTYIGVHAKILQFLLQNLRHCRIKAILSQPLPLNFKKENQSYINIFSLTHTKNNIDSLISFVNNNRIYKPSNTKHGTI